MDRVFDLIRKEEKRQKETLMMIPSENYTYPEVRKALGSFLTHKYSEGLPGKRYYQGNEFIDEIEKICQDRALGVFGLDKSEWGVNVQALSGAPANLSVYNALIDPGERILSLYLPDGGHLSHGWRIGDRKVTLVSKIYDVDFYHVDPQDYLIDYDELEKKAFSFRPRIIVSGGTAYPREIDYERIGSIAKKVGAYYLADVSHEAGLIAGGAAKRPFEFADVVSMTTHKTLRGPRGAIIFSRADISRKIDSSVFPGIQGGPHNEVIAGMAIALEKARHKEFREYATQTVRNARVLSSKLMDLNIPLVTSGTDKHLILIDLRPMELNGTRVAASLERAGIIVNKNSVPYDNASAFNPSGVRLGTPAVTARGMREKEMEKIADFIGEVMVNLENEKVLRRIRREVKNLCSDFSDIF